MILPVFMLYSVEAMSLSSANVRSLENCINTKYLDLVTKVGRVWNILERVLCWIIWRTWFSCDKFVDQLIGDGRFTNLLFTQMWLLYVRVYTVANHLSSVIVCLSLTFVHLTQLVEIFLDVSMPFCTRAVRSPSWTILRRLSQQT